MTGVVVWFTGLPSSGKSTLAERVRERVDRAILIDGDDLRAVLGADAYEPADRDAFYRVLGRLAGLLARQGHVVLVPATAPLRRHRDYARELAPRFVEVWVRTPLAECERRDVKGLYARARAGEAPELPGIGAAYEPPESPDLVADGGHDASAVAAVAARL